MRAFVEEQKLRHPILLQGGSVALDAYGVSGFPTGFFIDREGRIASREVGFGPGAEKKLRATAEAMLAAK